MIGTKILPDPVRFWTFEFFFLGIVYVPQQYVCRREAQREGVCPVLRPNLHFRASSQAHIQTARPIGCGRPVVRLGLLRLGAGVLGEKVVVAAVDTVAEVFVDWALCRLFRDFAAGKHFLYHLVQAVVVVVVGS